MDTSVDTCSTNNGASDEGIAYCFVESSTVPDAEDYVVSCSLEAYAVADAKDSGSGAAEGAVTKDSGTDSAKVAATLVDAWSDNNVTADSFQLQMGFSFPFLRANDLSLSLLNIRAHSFLLSCT